MADIVTVITLLFAIYVILLLVLKEKNLFEKYNLSLYGPFLAWKTERGKRFIRKLSKPRSFWSIFATVAIFICFVTMAFMLYLLVGNVTILMHLPKESIQRLPGVEMVIAIPGINPILPIGYTIVGLIVAIVVHELSHGILCNLGGIKIRSLGLVAFIFPVGAFVEPDEEQLRSASTFKRMKVFAAGPGMNLLVALVCMLVFSFVFMPFVHPTDGAMVLYVVKNSPAEEVGISSWMLITEINGNKIRDAEDFMEVMNATKPGEKISVKCRDLYGKILTKEVVLAEKYNFTNRSMDKGIGFLGVGVSNVFRKYLDVFKNPFAHSISTFLVEYYGAPFIGFFTGYNPLAQPYTNYYEIRGPFAIVPDFFWVIANAFYWIFWLNFAVGMFNALPIYPFDGGNLIQDAIKGTTRKLLKSLSKEKIEKITKLSTISISLLTLFLVLAPIFMKYISLVT